MNPEHLNLVQAEIDGFNSPADSERVRTLLAADSELRSAFDELQSVKLAIESFRELEPPASLKASIMSAIPERVPGTVRAPSAVRSSAPAQARSWWSGIVDLVRLPTPVTLAYAFSLGLIVAFVVSTVVRPQAPASDMDPVFGTMFSPDPAHSALIAEYNLDKNGSKGVVRVTRLANDALVEFVWDQTQPVSARIAFDADRLSVAGTRTLEQSDDFRSVAAGGEIVVSGSGPISQMIVLRNADSQPARGAEVHFDVRSGDTVLLDRTVTFDDEQ